MLLVIVLLIVLILVTLHLGIYRQVRSLLHFAVRAVASDGFRPRFIRSFSLSELAEIELFGLGTICFEVLLVTVVILVVLISFIFLV